MKFYLPVAHAGAPQAHRTLWPGVFLPRRVFEAAALFQVASDLIELLENTDAADLSFLALEQALKGQKKTSL